MKIKTVLALILFGISGISRSHADDVTAPFTPVKEAILETISHQLKESEKPALFSIAMNERIGPISKKIQISDEFAEVLQKLFPDRWKHYIPYTELRIPSNDELDPSDPKKERLRGYESKDGKRVAVLTILFIQYVSPEKMIIGWSFSSGNLSGGGGSYELSKKGTGWLISPKDNFVY